MTTNAIGLDIGGANLKRADSAGTATSRRFALWKEPAKLGSELLKILDNPPRDWGVGVTMTGELCDCFRTKREGVQTIVRAVEEALPGGDPRFWSVSGGFLSAAEAIAAPLAVAAANWHAQATFVGRLAPRGLAVMIDMGSTTTDVIPLVDGSAQPEGFSDVGRLRSGELLYFVMRRTPLCALRPAGCAEFFATTHDVSVLLGLLPEEPENRETADGRPMTRECAWERIARTLGGDRETLHDAEVIAEASQVLQSQAGAILRSLDRIEQRFARPIDRLILTGSGERRLRDLFSDLKPKTPQIVFSEHFSPALSEAACAFAVATLCSERLS